MDNTAIAQTLDYLVGTRYVAGVKPYIRELTGRERVLGPHDFSTREYDIGRINVITDGHGRIAGFNFG